MNLPNQITIARLILAVLFFILISRFDIRDPDPRILDICLILFIVACLTDWLDGYLARRTNQVTALGRVLDPFVDKVLVCGAFVFFAGAGFVDSAGRNVTAVAPWMVVVIVGRELLVTGLRGFSEAQGRPFAADVLGKIKTITQMITASVIMLCVAHAAPGETRSLLAGAGGVLLWLTIVITSCSGLNYLYKARKMLLGRL
ncbi:MAG: CDP-diacylglycerol--glycerol-3-phosphate 3-phosphatidyltransferase [Planctomycetes bacterium]|nr:CDP-diacylglycerol--glycerol-3-phosphate 3-phosphatidyltransferase [Planctomycetota bacterium]